MAYQNHDQDIDELGRAIQDVIDQAINSQNYQKLNQTVRQTVSHAIENGSDTVRRILEQTFPDGPSGSNPVQRSPYNSSGHRVTVDPRNPRNSRPSNVQNRENLPALYRNTSDKMSLSVTKAVGGGLLAGGAGGLMLLNAAFKFLFTGAAFWSFSTFLMAVAGIGGAALLVNGIQNISLLNRFQQYVKTIGRKTYCSIDKLARASGIPSAKVRKDVYKMIDQGLFLEGHVDSEGTGLITSDETYEHYLRSLKQQREKKLEETFAANPFSNRPAQAGTEQRNTAAPENNAQKKEPAKNLDPQLKDVLDKGNAFLQEIRRCNREIPGEEISQKISRMEVIVQRIFERAEAHPEIIPDLKKMMDYYLPMTVKLLQAYADMDKQPIQGETIQASKREIEATLDTLNLAFEKLLDSIFKDTAMDVSSDISVLQTLLAQEGLTDDDLSQLRKDTNDIL